MRSAVCVGGDLCHFPAKKKVVPMHGYRNVTPNPNVTIFCSQTRFGLNHTHQCKKRGVKNLPPKDLLRGPVCWSKMVLFWKPWKHTFWPSPEYRELSTSAVDYTDQQTSWLYRPNSIVSHLCSNSRCPCVSNLSNLFLCNVCGF